MTGTQFVCLPQFSNSILGTAFVHQRQRQIEVALPGTGWSRMADRKAAIAHVA
jgi:hypothetical protein